MATSREGKHQPTNSDLLTYLEMINEKLSSVDKRLISLEKLEMKVENFDKEMKKLWVYIEDKSKKSDERIEKIENKTESTDFSLGLVNDKMIQLEKEKENLHDELVYLQSQSMRNNLVFGNIPEAPTEDSDETEKNLRNFMHEKMKVASEIVDAIKFERVHRMGPKGNGRCRKIVAKFTLFKEREMIRKQWKTLESTPFFVHEQFPREVSDKRRLLLPKMKEARKQGKTAWLAYDTLYIDGRPVKD
jgi:hypothetical protein